MSTTISPNMNLTIPGVGTEDGPDYALDINACMNIIDQHTHSSGSGVQITPAGMNISSTLSMNNNLLSNIMGLKLQAQGSTPAVNTIYESGTDLYFVDGLGNNVRITQSGGVAGSPGSISNLTSPASASYVSGSSTFIWQSGASIAANMDFGAAIMRNLSPNSTYALTLQPPAALAANYSITLPSLPVSQSFVTIDTSGAMGTLSLLGSLTTANLSASAGITGGQIASATITGTNIASNIALPGQAVTAGGQYVVVSNTNPSTHNLAVISVRFDQTTILSGEGITLGNPTPGVYNVTFSSAFTSVPACIATCENGSARIATVNTITGSGCIVESFDLTGTNVQCPINFIAIGQKT